MALEDIVFPDGDAQNITMIMNRGNIGVVSDIETESDSNPGMLLAEWGTTMTVTTAYTWVS